MHQRCIQVSHETLREWNIRFAPLITEELCHREPRRGSRWFLDEVCIDMTGKKFWLWRAVDESGAVLGILLQTHRNTNAAKIFFEQLLINYDVPDVIHTDKLWSYGAAIRELPVLYAVEHTQVISTARCNNLIEQSHRLTREQKRSGQASLWALFCSRSQLGFKNPRRAQEFLALHARVSNLHESTRTTVPALNRRRNQSKAHLAWQRAIDVAV
ncbi:putative transposase [Deinococcus sp. UYEF24]